MRKFVYAVMFLCGALLIVTMITCFLLSNEDVSSWLIQRSANGVAKHLVIERTQGSILSRLTLYGVEYHTNQHHISIEQVKMNWQPLALLWGKLHLRSLSVGGVTLLVEPIHGNPASAGTTPVRSRWSLPLPLVIEDARFDHLLFRLNGFRYEFDHLSGAALLDESGIHLQRVIAEGNNLQVNLQGKVVPNHPFAFKGNCSWTAQLPHGRKARGECNISGNAHTIAITHKLKEPVYLEIQGDVKISRVLPEANPTGMHEDGRHLFIADAGYGVEEEQQHISKSTESYQLIFNGDLKGQSMPPIHFQSYAKGSLRSWHIEKLLAHTLGGDVKAHGRVIWLSEPSWHLAMSATNVDPSVQWPGWPGKLALKAKLQGQIASGTPSVLVTDLSIDGHLLEQPLKVRGNLNLRGRQLAHEELKVFLGKNYFAVKGSGGDFLDLAFHVDAADPGKLWPGLEGRFRGQGVFKGTPDELTTTGSFTASNISYRKCKVEKLDGYFTWDSRNGLLAGTRVESYRLQLGEEIFPKLSFEIAGDFRNYRVHSDFLSTSGRTEIEFKGGCHQEDCEIKVNRVSFDLNEKGKWRLRDPLALVASHTDLRPFEACWVHENSSTCLRGSWNQGSGWKLEGAVSAPPVKFIINILKTVKDNLLEWVKET